ncbi:MAG TPA: 3-phosphoshikimate 1-carboxyvinyltransferase, partial [Atopostipes sp.]|nr:3-phosphoshikimate 1-carboxyvinyltransferase [Atopostipes sp.]
VGDELHIQGVSKLQGNSIGWSHQDHRMAMMLAIASTICEEEIVVRDAHYVSKSYPTFWKEFEALGGRISEWNMGK